MYHPPVMADASAQVFAVEAREGPNSQDGAHYLIELCCHLFADMMAPIIHLVFWRDGWHPAPVGLPACYRHTLAFSVLPLCLCRIPAFAEDGFTEDLLADVVFWPFSQHFHFYGFQLSGEEVCCMYFLSSLLHAIFILAGRLGVFLAFASPDP